MSQYIGKQSIRFQNPPYLTHWASVVGKKEGEGPLGKNFDVIEEDDYFGADTWEGAESQLQKQALEKLLCKSGCKTADIRYLFAGDLLGQVVATTFGLMEFQIPLFGLYGACSTAGESLSLAAMAVAGGYAEQVVALTSSHFASAERQFRFPLEYAGQRPLSATWTVTGSGAFLVSDHPNPTTENGVTPEKTNLAKKNGAATEKACPVKITGITTGRVVDYGVKDSMNMGAAMAPAAADLIEQSMKDFGFTPKDYDKIVTGDLGEVGQKLLLDLLREKGVEIAHIHEDCGMKIYDNKEQKTGSGGSGCGCSAVTLAAHYLPRLVSGEYKRVLFVPTGALLSTISFNEGNTVPGIAHGVLLESVG